MSLNQDQQVVVWSIDPNDEKVMPSTASVGFLQHKVVYPVYIHGPELDSGRKKLDDYLLHFPYLKLKPGRTISSATHSKIEQVKRIILYAIEKKASFIALSSHGRKGLNHLIMGSFAEKLLSESPIPVLFLSSSEFNHSRKAIFATDYSERAEEAFRHFTTFCRGSIREVILYHAEHTISDAVAIYGSVGVPAMFPNGYLKGNASGDELMNEWIQKTERYADDLKIFPVVKDTGTTIGKSIIEECEKSKAELVGVCTELRPWERTLFGSVAQDVFRNCKVPVWTWGEFATDSLIRQFETSILKPEDRAQRL